MFCSQFTQWQDTPLLLLHAVGPEQGAGATAGTSAWLEMTINRARDAKEIEPDGLSSATAHTQVA